MSELINNKYKRQEILKDLIKQLHQGKTVEEVKPKFEKLIEGVSATEISDMERKLIEEGMAVEEIQKLCDVHAAVFKGSVSDIHSDQKLLISVPGHPVNTLQKENLKIVEFINEYINPHIYDNELSDEVRKNHLKEDFRKLLEIDKHYSRKENLIFPYMEKHNITAPPKVMWAVDDEIRKEIKAVIKKLESEEIQIDDIKSYAVNITEKVTEMISKEENIMIPMILETFSIDEWKEIADSESEIGFTFINPPLSWKGTDKNQNNLESTDSMSTDDVYFDAGSLSAEEINSIFNTLPVDLTFVDSNGKVKYFSQGKDRIFARPKTILGREVKNCHPPASVHIVEKIVSDFEKGIKDNEDFWIKMGNKFVYIRYYAVRNNEGRFLGTLEITQNIKGITELQGEKRLLSED